MYITYNYVNKEFLIFSYISSRKFQTQHGIISLLEEDLSELSDLSDKNHNLQTLPSILCESYAGGSQNDVEGCGECDRRNNVGFHSTDTDTTNHVGVIIPPASANRGVRNTSVSSSNCKTLTTKRYI